VPLHTAMLACMWHCTEMTSCSQPAVPAAGCPSLYCPAGSVHVPAPSIPACLLHQVHACMRCPQLLCRVPCNPVTRATSENNSGWRKTPGKRLDCAMAGAALTAVRLPAAVQLTQCSETAAGAAAERRQLVHRHRLRRLFGPVVHAQPGGAAPGVVSPASLMHGSHEHSMLPQHSNTDAASACCVACSVPHVLRV
jgi:hypothetical protein